MNSNLNFAIWLLTVCFPEEYVPASQRFLSSVYIDGQAYPGGQSVHVVWLPSEYVPCR